MNAITLIDPRTALERDLDTVECDLLNAAAALRHHATTQPSSAFLPYMAALKEAQAIINESMEALEVCHATDLVIMQNRKAGYGAH